MRHLFLCFLFVIALSPVGTFSQTIIVQESFETDGEGTRYTSNSGENVSLSDIWDRTNLLPHTYHSTTIGTGTLNGSFYWAAEDIGSLHGIGTFGFLTLNAVNISGYTNLEVVIALGLSRHGQTRWENDDILAVEYNIDGGGWNIIGLYTGDNAGAGLGGLTRLDTDNDPSTLGPHGDQMEADFTDYTFAISATGSSMQIRIRTNVDGSEEFGFDNVRVQGDVPTPVEWLSFDVETENNDAHLSWTVAQEENNEGFYIEQAVRPLDGSQPDFQQVGFVAGRGTVSTPFMYQYSISDQAAGHYVYRLKQVDLDGSFEYSKVVEARIGSSFQLQIFPNPAGNQFTIAYSLAEESKVQAIVYDLMGRHLFTSSFLSQAGLQNSHQLEVGHLPNGEYLLEVKTAQEVVRKRFVKFE
ncbi:MAG: T9SS type A sorting domain-containing protein [Bacteroidota bacterium]